MDSSLDSPLDSPPDSPPGRLLRSGSSGRRNTTIDESQDEDARTAQGQDQRRAVSFCISNEEAVEEAYEIRLRQIQQMGLKKILKAWIKVAEPKKQTNYPYISSREGQNREPKVPPWWPIDRVIHKEPDHINKEGMYVMRVVDLADQHSANHSSYCHVTYERKGAGMDCQTGGVYEECGPQE